MTQDEIIEMAREAAAQITIQSNGDVFYSFYGIELETFAKLVFVKAFEEGFFAGFEASGEGFNGEWPYGDRGINIRTDKYVLHKLKEAKAKA